jgi:hypothetical protein
MPDEEGDHTGIRALRSSGNTTDEENRMYPDNPPKKPANIPVKKVIVLQGPPETADEVMAGAREHGAVQSTDDGDIFWIVYEDRPNTAWPCTEEQLRKSYENQGWLDGE